MPGRNGATPRFKILYKERLAVIEYVKGLVLKKSKSLDSDAFKRGHCLPDQKDRTKKVETLPA